LTGYTVAAAITLAKRKAKDDLEIECTAFMDSKRNRI
jgi:hypothetical protein